MGVVEYSGSSLNTYFYLSKFEPNANLGQFIIYRAGVGVATFNAVTLPENADFGFVQLGQPVKIKIYVDPNTQIVVTATLRTGPFFLLARLR